jgi:hypothetical protein
MEMGKRTGTQLAITRCMTKKTGELPGKAGVKSLSQKLQNSRHAFEPHPGASKTPGAFGREDSRGVEDVDAAASDRERDEG